MQHSKHTIKTTKNNILTKVTGEKSTIWMTYLTINLQKDGKRIINKLFDSIFYKFINEFVC